MLILSRNEKERIMIGEDIVLTVIEICKERVRIGINAPREIPVHREEIYDAIKRKESEERNEN